MVGTRTWHVPLAFEIGVGGHPFALAEISSYFGFLGVDCVFIGGGFVFVVFEGLEQKGAESDGFPALRNRWSIAVFFLIELAGEFIGSWWRRVVFLDKVDLVAKTETGASFALHGGQIVNGLGYSRNRVGGTLFRAC